MTLRPLGDRILIRPIANDDHTESGLVLVEHRKPETMGTVIAVGTCAHPLKAEAEKLATRLCDLVDTSVKYELHANSEDETLLTAAAIVLRTVTAREPLVTPGDTVIFSW